MKAIISRLYQDEATLGIFHIMDGNKKIFECKTIELPWKNNRKNVSCIPEGTYNVEKYKSPSKGLCFHIIDVEGRDSILIHKGNYVKSDTKGCILVGQYFTDLDKDGIIDVAESTKTLQSLLERLPDIFKLVIF